MEHPINFCVLKAFLVFANLTAAVTLFDKANLNLKLMSVFFRIAIFFLNIGAYNFALFLLNLIALGVFWYSFLQAFSISFLLILTFFAIFLYFLVLWSLIILSLFFKYHLLLYFFLYSLFVSSHFFFNNLRFSIFFDLQIFCFFNSLVLFFLLVVNYLLHFGGGPCTYIW